MPCDPSQDTTAPYDPGFWDRQQRIRQLTILTNRDAVPWELLYPRDSGHDEGFLVDQFPVTRAVFGRRLPRKLSLRPARFVLPGSLPGARREIEAMQQLLDPGQSPGMVVSALTPLQELIQSGDFGLLHFACHNRFDPTDGSSIMLGNVPFTPEDLTEVAIERVLAGFRADHFSSTRAAVRGSVLPITGLRAGPASSSRPGPPRSSDRYGRYPTGPPVNSPRSSTASFGQDPSSGTP